MKEGGGMVGGVGGVGGGERGGRKERVTGMKMK